jgi:hypothetical protein
MDRLGRGCSIHQRDVGVVFSELLDSFAPVGRLGDQLHIRLGSNQASDAVADNLVIVRRKNSNHNLTPMTAIHLGFRADVLRCPQMSVFGKISASTKRDSVQNGVCQGTPEVFVLCAAKRPSELAERANVCDMRTSKVVILPIRSREPERKTTSGFWVGVPHETAGSRWEWKWKGSCDSNAEANG